MDSSFQPLPAHLEPLQVTTASEAAILRQPEFRMQNMLRKEGHFFVEIVLQGGGSHLLHQGPPHGQAQRQTFREGCQIYLEASGCSTPWAVLWRQLGPTLSLGAYCAPWAPVRVISFRGISTASSFLILVKEVGKNRSMTMYH